jgi:hypothetical protein
VDSAGNSELRSTFEPSEITAFVILVEGHTRAKSYWWWLWWFLRPLGIPIDEANLSGHLIVKDASDEEVVQGVLPLRLNNVAPGYGRARVSRLMAVPSISFVIAARSIRAGARRTPRTEKRDMQVKKRALRPDTSVTHSALHNKSLLNDTSIHRRVRVVTSLPSEHLQEVV